MESIILGPDNFLLFVFLFTVSLAFAVLTIRAYERSIPVYLNAGMFLLCAIRACTEFGMQLTNSVDEVFPFNMSNSIIVHLCFALSWFLFYYYIRPFKNFRHHKVIDFIVTVFLIGLPNLIIFYFFVTFQLFEFSAEKIDGYWMFRPISGPLSTFYQLYTFPVMIGLYTSAMMIYSIVTNRRGRVKQIGLLLAFYALTFVIITSALAYSSGSWRVTNHTIPMLIDSIILTWFISGYRLLKNNYQSASTDVLNSISELVVRTDKKFKILDQNTTAQSFFESDSDHIKELLNIDTSTNESIGIHTLIENMYESSEMSIVVNGENKYLNARAAPYQWRGKDLGYTFIFSDITPLKESEQALEVSNRTKDQLFSIISHDLRKPALAFRGITKKINNLLQKEDFIRLNKLGDSIEKSAQSLNALLDNLLQWSLTQKEAIHPSSRIFNVVDVIDDINSQFGILMSEKRITIDNSQLDKELLINNDPDLISTIIRNIVDNAIKYSSEQGVIYVSGKETNDEIYISIRDEGIGMSEDQQQKLSSLYESKSTRGTHGERGSGLGMNLVYELVHVTKGKLKVKSKEGVGTEVILVYPKNASN